MRERVPLGLGRTVSWVYPVTVDPTSHRARFSSGEEVYAP